MEADELKRCVSFCILLIIASAFAKQAFADGSGPWGGLGWDTTTQGQKSRQNHYDDPAIPYRGSGPPDLSLIADLLIAGAIVSIVAFAVYMRSGEKSPEQALKEHMKSSETT